MENRAKRQRDPATHQPSKAEIEEDASIDATPEALAWAVTRGGAERSSSGEGEPEFIHQTEQVTREYLMNLEIGASQNDALSLEYKLQNRNPLRQVDIADFVGDSALHRFTGTEVSHFEEQLIDVVSS